LAQLPADLRFGRIRTQKIVNAETAERLSPAASVSFDHIWVRFVERRNAGQWNRAVAFPPDINDLDPVRELWFA
jgi:hypothetical protein